MKSASFTDREVNVALQKLWENDGAKPGEHAGNKIARVRVLLSRVASRFTALEKRLRRGFDQSDLKEIRKALQQSFDRKYPGTCVDDVAEDVWDVVEALEIFPPMRRKRR